MKTSLTIISVLVSSFWAGAIDERIWVDAKINGHPVQFAFDTGFGLPIAIFTSEARKLGLKITPPSHEPDPGKAAFGTTEPCDLDLGTTNFHTTVFTYDLPDYLKEKAVGIVGWPAVSENIFSLDAIRQEMVFFKDAPKVDKPWVIVNVTTNTQLTLEIPGPGRTYTVLLDTGKGAGVTLHPKRWQEWKLAHTNQPVTLEAYFMPGAGLVVREESFAHELTLGALTLTEVPVMEANQAETTSDDHFEAAFGLAAMKRMEIIIDGKHGIGYLRPRQTSPQPYEHNRLGAVFAPKDLQSENLVAHVVPGGPAFAVGIRDNDLLMKIRGLDTTKWRTDPNVLPLSRFWNSPAGSILELTVKRGENIFKVDVVLENILPPDTAKRSN